MRWVVVGPRCVHPRGLTLGHRGVMQYLPIPIALLTCLTLGLGVMTVVAGLADVQAGFAGT